jgi:hypothetical protein
VAQAEHREADRDPAGDPQNRDAVERDIGPWRVESVSDLLARLGVPEDVLKGAPTKRPLVIAIDGRGGAGKSTLAHRLRDAVPASAIVHTDDLAWHHSFFDWAQLMRDEVLVPLHAGRSVNYRPSAWEQRGRPGAIEVPAGLAAVWLKGTGSIRRELTDLVDAAIWIHADAAEAERRLVARDGSDEEVERVKREWNREGDTFLQDQRPWHHATVIVACTTDIRHEPIHEVVTAPPAPGPLREQRLRRRSGRRVPPDPSASARVRTDATRVVPIPRGRQAAGDADEVPVDLLDGVESTPYRPELA